MTLSTGPLPRGIWSVLRACHESPVAVQSDFARSHSWDLALAASQGWVSTVFPDGKTYGGRWFITAAGITALANKENF